MWSKSFVCYPLYPASVVHDPADAPSVFISYAHADEPLARDLADALSGHGLRVWIDQSELRIGDSLIERLAEAIAEGDFVVALVSDVSRESRWCKQELAWAASKGIREKRVTVLPLQVGNAEMPSTLADRVWADVTLESVDELADGLRGK